MKAEQWVQALRSGKYSQGQNALCDGENYCCLGVLAAEAGYEMKPDQDGDVFFSFPTPNGIRHDDATIPLTHQEKILVDLDLRKQMPEDTLDDTLYCRGSLHNRLITLNDEGRTFDFIADYIEKVANGQR